MSVEAFDGDSPDRDFRAPISRSARRRRMRSQHLGDSGTRVLIGRFEAGQIDEDDQSDDDMTDEVFDRGRLRDALESVEREPGADLSRLLDEAVIAHVRETPD